MTLRYENLKVGDVVGTTSHSALAMSIRTRTWGWKNIFNMTKSSHTAVVVDRGKGLLYFAEMLAKGITLTEIHKYKLKPTLGSAHICWIGRHPLMNQIRSEIFNDTILELHSRRIKYGYDDLINYISCYIGLKLNDNDKTLICSELPRVAFGNCGIQYPSSWEAKCSPADWQNWKEMKTVTHEVIV